MSTEFLKAVEEYGSAAGELVDLSRTESSEITRYIDLVRWPVDDREVAAFEVGGQPLAFVVDARKFDDTAALAARWVHRISFRGDAQWVALLRPGRLDVYEVGLTDDKVELIERGELPEGPLRLPALAHLPTPKNLGAVRKKLFVLLDSSLRNLEELGVSDQDAMALVGRGLFWRFLIDRDLLEGLRPESVCPAAMSWDSCFDTRARARRSFEWLDETFNGGLLPLSSASLPEKAFTDVLAHLTRAATPNEQLRLPDMWQEVDFSHIPVGLLSEIYEAWAHRTDPVAADSASIHYTPRHLVELVVAEALKSAEGIDQPKVLDPAAGAGVFLVTAFRALVEREWHRRKKRPSRAVVRRILNEQLQGFDVNGAALRLAELGLYLTAIELDPEAKPRPLKLLKFDELRGNTLIELPGGPKLGSLAAVESAHFHQYDLVIGNPPWTSKKGAPKKAWVKATLGLVKQRLGDDRAKDFDFPDNNPDLPFVYRAMDWAREGGTIALCLHARWLFGQSERAEHARNDLLKAVQVTGILNGSALRHTRVWPGVTAPWCVLFARNKPAPPGAAFHFVSPQLEEPNEHGQETLRIDWLDASEIGTADLERRPWLLKARFRGTPLDESALEQVMRKGIELGSYLGELNTTLNNGYQVGGSAGTQQSARILHELPDLKNAQVAGFVVDVRALKKVARDTLLFVRSREIYRAPLLLVRQSIDADELSARSLIAEKDVAFHESFHGASFTKVEHGTAIARYLQLVFQSRYTTWFELLTDSRFGVERDVVFKNDFLRLPVIPWSGLNTTQREQVATLSKRMTAALDPGLLREIDEFVFGLFGLFRAQRDAIYDTLSTARPSRQAKKNATRRTTLEERTLFATTCSLALNRVLEASDKTATVTSRAELDQPGWRFVQIERRHRAPQDAKESNAKPKTRPLHIEQWRELAEKSGASVIRIALDNSCDVIALLDRYRHWTVTRADLLALSLLSDRGDDA